MFIPCEPIMLVSLCAGARDVLGVEDVYRGLILLSIDFLHDRPLSLQGTSMPINIPMMGRANTFDSAAANDNLDLDFVPPHIIEQQKVGLSWLCVCSAWTALL